MDYLDELIEYSKEHDPLFAPVWRATELVDSLAQRREALGLSQQEVADRMGVARARVSEIENHPDRVSFARILAYAASVDAELSVTAAKVAQVSLSMPRGRPVVAAGARQRKRA